MGKDDFLKQIYDLKFTACCNQRYYQKVAWGWMFADTTVRIAMSTAGLVGTVKTFAHLSGDWIYWLAGITAFVSIVLTVVPFASREVKASDFYRRWTFLRQGLEVLEVAVKASEAKGPKTEHIERFQGLLDMKHEIDSEETDRLNWLWDWAEGDEWERRFGHGVRSSEQAEAYLKNKRLAEAAERRQLETAGA